MQIDIEAIRRLFPRYEVQRLLGSGSFANVYLAIEPQTQAKLAIKKINCFGMCEYQKNSSINEAKILAQLSHQNIIRLNAYKYDECDDNLYIMMEYAEGGDLMEVISKAKAQEIMLREDYIWQVLTQLADGLRYMHEKRIIHRDIKPSNIFLSKNRVKLGDMNVSRILESGMAETKIGSPHYVGPQIWTGNGYNEKCDIWSLGVVVYEMCCLGLPFDDREIQEMLRGNGRQKKFTIPPIYSSKLQTLISKMLKFNVRDRIQISQIQQLCQTYNTPNHQQQDLDLMLETGFLCPQKQPLVIIPLSHKSCKQLKQLGSAKSIRMRKVKDYKITKEVTLSKPTQKQNKRQASNYEHRIKLNLEQIRLESKFNYNKQVNEKLQTNIKSCKNIYAISKSKNSKRNLHLSPYQFKINFNLFLNKEPLLIKKHNFSLFSEHLKKINSEQ